MEYGDFRVKEGVYVPDMGIEYPTDDPYKRLLTVQVEDSTKGKYRFDENYPYIDKSWAYKLHNFIGFFVQWIVATFWNRTHFGLKIRGRQNLKGYEDSLKNGAMCVCNHVYVFDALCVYQAIRRFRKLWIPMYAKHFNGNMSWFMRRVGGIPIPETLEGFKKFNEAFDEYHKKKEWMLLFPESTRWNYYKPLRPFKRGAFSMAYKYDIPVIPTVITYRKRKGLYRLFGKKNLPCMTIHVGKPILINKEENRKEELDRLRTTAHSMMLEMAGIEVNPWPAIPDVE